MQKWDRGEQIAVVDGQPLLYSDLAGLLAELDHLTAELAAARDEGRKTVGRIAAERDRWQEEAEHWAVQAAQAIVDRDEARAHMAETVHASGEST
jgi:hypothetical protein